MENSKRYEHSSRGVPSVDRISALPESLIIDILSLLPTHCAVQTCILSKRWRHMWTKVTSLEFDDELFDGSDYENENKKFEQFVYRVLALVKTPCLQLFRLRCGNVSDTSHMSTWISAALSRHVRDLMINVYPYKSIEIPVNFFTCKTLSSLVFNFDYCTTLDVPNSICLPNLKDMEIYGFKFANDETFPKLLSGCPVLEDLWVERDDLDDIFNFIISSSTLKILHLDFVADIKPDSPRHTLQIDAPLLEYLYLNDGMSNEFVIQNLSSLIQADISLHINERNNAESGYGNKVLKLINMFSNVKFLQLSGATMKALSYAREHTTPVFRNLTKLHGDFGCKHEACGIQPDEVPKYLLSHLTSVGFNNFDGSSDQLMMVKFILNESKSLKRMAIITSRPEIKLDDLLQEITMFPRLSKLCEIVVSEQSVPRYSFFELLGHKL